MTVKQMRSLLRGVPGNYKMILSKDKGAKKVTYMSENAHKFMVKEFGKYHIEVYDEKESAYEEMDYKENCIVFLPEEK